MTETRARNEDGERLRENYLHAMSTASHQIPAPVEPARDSKKVVSVPTATNSADTTTKSNEGALVPFKSTMTNPLAIAVVPTKPLAVAPAWNDAARPMPPLTTTIVKPGPLAAPPYQLLRITNGQAVTTNRNHKKKRTQEHVPLNNVKPTPCRSTTAPFHPPLPPIQSKRLTEMDAVATTAKEGPRNSLALTTKTLLKSSTSLATLNVPPVVASHAHKQEAKQEYDEDDDMPDFLVGFDRAVSKLKAEQQEAETRNSKTSGQEGGEATRLSVDINRSNNSGNHYMDQNLIVSTPPITSSRSFDDFHQLLGDHPDLVPLDETTTNTTAPVLGDTVPSMTTSEPLNQAATKTSRGVLSDNNSCSRTQSALDKTSIFSAEVYAMFARESAIAVSLHEAYLASTESSGQNHPETSGQQGWVQGVLAGQREGPEASHAQHQTLLSSTDYRKSPVPPEVTSFSAMESSILQEGATFHGPARAPQEQQQGKNRRTSRFVDQSTSSPHPDRPISSSASHFVKSDGLLKKSGSKRKRANMTDFGNTRIAPPPVSSAIGDSTVVVSETSATERASSEGSSEDQSASSNSSVEDNDINGDIGEFESLPSSSSNRSVGYNTNLFLGEHHAGGSSQSMW